MPTFDFKAASSDGVVECGSLEAKSKSEAYELLRKKNLRPVSINRNEGSQGDGSTAPPSENAPIFDKIRRLSSAQILLFTEELSELLDAGLQLEPALRVIESRKEKSALKPVAAWLRQQVRDGVSFSNALRRCRNCFSELFCSMVAAGEAAGALPQILKRQAEHFAIMTELRKRVSMALVYPSIVFSAGIVLLIIFVSFLLPQLTSLLSRTGQQLPLMTRLLIGISEFFGAYWWAVLLLMAALATAFTTWKKSPKGRMTWDRVQLDLPLVGSILRTQFLAEFSQTLATLVSNGVTLINSLALLQKATPNLYLKGVLGRILDRVGEGSSLTSALRQHAFFPDVLIDVVTVGEQTGDLAGALLRGAKRYDREFTNRIARLTTLIQPITILIVALFVGLVAYSMITGILTSVSGLRGR